MKQKWYVVWVGRVPGVYTDWTRAEDQVKGYPNARYKGFDNRDEAYREFKAGLPKSSQIAKMTPKTGAERRLGSTLATSTIILHMQLSLDQLTIKLRAFRRESPGWKSPDLKNWKYKPLYSRRGINH